MRRAVLALTLVGACRGGFDEAQSEKKPGPSGVDADPSIDSPRGFGSYRITRQTAPYLAPVGAQLVPGFAEGADEETYGLLLPFTFVFYGISYDVVTASVNGFVTFGIPPSGEDSYFNDCPMNDTAPDAQIAVFWDDLFASATITPKGTISYAVEGTAPYRQFSIEWRDMDGWFQSGQSFYNTGMHITQKLVLREDNSFDLHYGPRSTPAMSKWDCGQDRYRGCSATIGIEAPGSISFNMISCGTAAGAMPGFTPVDNGTLIRFTPD
jgi:hypothetical protein